MGKTNAIKEKQRNTAIHLLTYSSSKMIIFDEQTPIALDARRKEKERGGREHREEQQRAR